MTEKLLSRQELAEHFGCSVATIRRWERAGKLKAVRLSANTVRYSRAEVEQFITSATEAKELPSHDAN